MTAVERYLRELSGAVRTSGRARRRLLDECREHLIDAAAFHGDEEAVRRFGDAAELAASFDNGIAAHRAERATVGTLLAVLSVGASTVALLNATDPRASAVTAWAVAFFACAQAAAVSALLACLRAAAMHHRPTSPIDVIVLCRRNSLALTFSALTLFAAAAAVPGHGSVAAVLAGPGAAALAALAVFRARTLARKLDVRRRPKVRAPLTDLRAVIGRPPGGTSGSSASPHTLGLLGPTLLLAMIGAFLWDRMDHGSNSSSLSAAGTEAAMVLVGFVLLGPALGLWSGRADKDQAPER
jgi:hypothetical protein